MGDSAPNLIVPMEASATSTCGNPKRTTIDLSKSGCTAPCTVP